MNVPVRACSWQRAQPQRVLAWGSPSSRPRAGPLAAAQRGEAISAASGWFSVGELEFELFQYHQSYQRSGFL